MCAAQLRPVRAGLGGRARPRPASSRRSGRRGSAAVTSSTAIAEGSGSSGCGEVSSACAACSASARRASRRAALSMASPTGIRRATSPRPVASAMGTPGSSAWRASARASPRAPPGIGGHARPRERDHARPVHEPIELGAVLPDERGHVLLARGLAKASSSAARAASIRRDPGASGSPWRAHEHHRHHALLGRPSAPRRRGSAAPARPPRPPRRAGPGPPALRPRPSRSRGGGRDPSGAWRRTAPRGPAGTSGRRGAGAAAASSRRTLVSTAMIEVTLETACVPGQAL